MANTRNALQAIYTNSDGNIKAYYYGNFDSIGDPNSINQLVINKVNGDTSLNLTLDEQLRVKSLYITIKGKKSDGLMTFDYSIPTQTIANVFYYNHENDSSRLINQFVVKDDNHMVIERTHFASIDILASIPLLQLNFGNNVPDKYGSQLIVLQGSIAALNLVIYAGTTAIGCILGGGIPGCIVGGIVADYLVNKPAAANAGTVDKFPPGIPPSPASGFKGNVPIKLFLSNIRYGSLNTCNIYSDKGSPNTMTFSFIDDSGALKSNNWGLYEQVGNQQIIKVSKAEIKGNSISFTGCIRFGSSPNIPASYYLQLDNGTKSNFAKTFFVKPPGAN